MKKSKMKLIIAAAVFLTFALFFAFIILDMTLPNVGREHTHVFDIYKERVEKGHLMACECGSTEVQEHVYDGYKPVTGTTLTCKGGMVVYTCEICAYQYTGRVYETGEHSFTDNMCGYCGYIIPTDEKYFNFTLLDDGTYSIAPKDVEDLPKNISFPASYNGKPVTVIADSAFEGNTRLNGVYIPDSVKEVGYAAFYNSSVGSVRMGNGVETLGRFAFGKCLYLYEISLSANLKTIGAYAFANCGILEEIEIPNSVEFIGNSAFARCTKLESVEMSANLVTLEEHAFDSCSRLKYIELPDTLRTLGSYCFNYCSRLDTLNIPENLEYIGDFAFYSCTDLEGKLVFPDSVYYIGISAFASCTSLTEVELPKYLAKIEENTFRGCYNLDILNLPENLAEIEYYAFYNCHSLPPSFPSSLKAIGRYAFFSCESGGEITFDGTVAEFNAIEIGNNAFYDISDTVVVCTDGKVKLISSPG